MLSCKDSIRFTHNWGASAGWGSDNAGGGSCSRGNTRSGHRGGRASEDSDGPEQIVSTFKYRPEHQVSTYSVAETAPAMAARARTTAENCILMVGGCLFC
jgi:hypothetical protein